MLDAIVIVSKLNYNIGQNANSGYNWIIDGTAGNYSVSISDIYCTVLVNDIEMSQPEGTHFKTDTCKKGN